MIIRNENINNQKDFIIRINSLQAQASVIKEDIKMLNIKMDNYREIAKYLATINKHAEIYLKYEKCSLFSKKQFYVRHEGDILSYEYALKKLEQSNINVDTPLDKIVSLVKEYKLQVDVLSRNFNVLKKRIDAVRNAKEIVNKIKDKGFDKKVEQKNIQEENL